MSLQDTLNKLARAANKSRSASLDAVEESIASQVDRDEQQRRQTTAWYRRQLAEAMQPPVFEAEYMGTPFSEAALRSRSREDLEDLERIAAEVLANDRPQQNVSGAGYSDRQAALAALRAMRQQLLEQQLLATRVELPAFVFENAPGMFNRLGDMFHATGPVDDAPPAPPEPAAPAIAPPAASTDRPRRNLILRKK